MEILTAQTLSPPPFTPSGSNWQGPSEAWHDFRTGAGGLSPVNDESVCSNTALECAA